MAAAPCAPLFLLFTARGVVPLTLEVLPHGMGRHVPLWALVAAQVSLQNPLGVSIGPITQHDQGLLAAFGRQGCVLGAALHATSTSKHVPAAGPLHWLLCAVAFVTSIAWISLCANELLGCLTALGLVMGISPTILGVTVRSPHPRGFGCVGRKRLGSEFSPVYSTCVICSALGPPRHGYLPPRCHRTFPLRIEKERGVVPGLYTLALRRILLGHLAQQARVGHLAF